MQLIKVFTQINMGFISVTNIQLHTVMMGTLYILQGEESREELGENIHKIKCNL